MNIDESFEFYESGEENPYETYDSDEENVNISNQNVQPETWKDGESTSNAQFNRI